MKSNIRVVAVGIMLSLLCLAAGRATAQEVIPWAADFKTACAMAGDQHRLVLVHFYNDNCAPCVRVDQNVFSRPEVAQAVAQNYVPVKVHAGKTPQLASRYRVTSWPTDVFVTPAGLEVYRTISPKEPGDYITLVNHVAMQAGVGAARQWQSQLGQATQPAIAGAAAATGHMQNAMSQAQSQAQQQWNAGVSQFDVAAQQARDAAQHPQFQAAGAVQQAAGAAGQWSQQAQDVSQGYAQQGGEAYRQFRDHANLTAQQVQQRVQDTGQQWQAAADQTRQQLSQASNAFTSPWQEPAAPLSDRRSAFVPADSPPPTEASAPAAAASPAAPAPSQPAAPPPSVTASNAPPLLPGASQAPMPTENPWVTARKSAPAAPPVAQSPPAAASLAAGQLVPVSQAPPVALDGFCPVTLLETVARDPADRSAWKKGDKAFGAIHLGRTYLFTSAENQQKFLANPDAFAPALAGCDPVHFAERGELIDGKRAYGMITPERQILLFADENTRNRYEQSPAAYSSAIQQAMRPSAGAGNLYR
jgi:thiol-disulfide isomerase/thioredoxin/YHS domain-containing protein